MIQQLFAALGVGSATVETRLSTPVVMPGDTVSGSVTLTGGTVDQQIARLSLFIMIDLDVEVGDAKVRQSAAMAEVPLLQAVKVSAGSRSELPFRFQLHPETPLTDLTRAGLPRNDPALTVKACGPRNRGRVWIHTGMDITSGVDGTDRDDLFVRPTGPQLVMLQALERLGMTLVRADVEPGRKRAGRAASTIGCYQEFEYRPPFLRFNHIEELEVTFVPRTRDTQVIFEVDRRRGRDTNRSLSMPHAGFAQHDWAAEVAQLLQR